MRNILNKENSIKDSDELMKQKDFRSKRDKETISKVKDTFFELKQLLKVVTYLGIRAEDERGRKAIISAVENVKAGDFTKTNDSLKDSCEFLKEKIDKTIDKELKKMRGQIALNESGLKHRDIERAMSKLEKGKNNNEYEEIPDLFFQAWDKVKKKST